MDIWIKHVSKNGVEIFELLNESHVAYKLPSYLFSCLKLTDLQLKNCILHPPLRFGGFRNLKSVELEDVIITADLSMGSQLEELVLIRCNGIEHFGCQFKCSNTNLARLVIIKSGAIDCQWFEFTRNVDDLGLVHDSGISIDEKVINFNNLIGYMPKISTLCINGHFLQFLEPRAANSCKLTTTMEKLKHLYLHEIDFSNLHEIKYILCLIQSSPNLQRLCISVVNFLEDSSDVMESEESESEEDSSMAVEQYLQLPNITDMILDKLETVEIVDMVGSEAELQLIKILLASSPKLKWMKLNCIDTKLSDPKEELKISRELLHFTRASSAAHIIWN